MDAALSLVKAIIENGDLFLYATYEGETVYVDSPVENGGIFGQNIVTVRNYDGVERYVSVSDLEDFEVYDRNEYGI